MKHVKLLIAGEWVSGDGLLEVTDKFSGQAIAHVERASQTQVDAAVAAAKQSFERHALEPHRRYEILRKASELIEQRRQELVKSIISESGFPLSDATNEVSRCVQTFL